MVPQIDRFLKWLMDCWNVQLAKLLPAAATKSAEVAVAPEIRQWFVVWLAKSRNIEAGKIHDDVILTAQEIGAAMTAFKKEFLCEMSSGPFQNHWSTTRVAKFLVHADFCNNNRRKPSSAKRKV